MPTLSEVVRQYDGLTPSRFDRAYIVKQKLSASKAIYRHLFGDDLGDYDVTGVQYRTKLEALVDLPARVSDYYGIEV